MWHQTTPCRDKLDSGETSSFTLLYWRSVISLNCQRPGGGIVVDAGRFVSSSSIEASTGPTPEGQSLVDAAHMFPDRCHFVPGRQAATGDVQKLSGRAVLLRFG